jgi:PIN domain nuclease of toxin-antitoxin system
VRLLVDTHAIVWAVIEPARLSATAREALADPDNDLLLSAVCAYEIEFKRDRDATLQRLPPDLRASLSGLGFSWLAVTAEHAVLAGRLPRYHGDPLDRLLIAQSMAEGAAIVSADRWFAAYGASVIW